MNHLKNVDKSSDKINSVTCASCWNFCIRIWKVFARNCRGI